MKFDVVYVLSFAVIVIILFAAVPSVTLEPALKAIALRFTVPIFVPLEDTPTVLLAVIKFAVV